MAKEIWPLGAMVSAADPRPTGSELVVGGDEVDIDGGGVEDGLGGGEGDVVAGGVVGSRSPRPWRRM